MDLFVVMLEDNLEKSGKRTWREELINRDSKGRFAKKSAAKAIRKGSRVVTKNGSTGKVAGMTDTHYLIDTDDGRKSRIVRDNVLHEAEYNELTKNKGAKGNEKKSTGKTGKKPAKASTGAKRRTAPKSAPAGAASGKRASGTKEPGGAKDKGEVKKSAVRKGSPVVTSTGRKGKVSGASKDGTKWLIDTEDGKKIQVKKENVTHAKDSKTITASKTAGGTGNATKTSTKTTGKRTTKPKGAGADASTEPKGTGKAVQGGRKKTTSSEGGATNKPANAKGRGRAGVAGARKGEAASKKVAEKKPKGIRSDVQKNRSLAYDAGEKVGGARKDMYEMTFRENPNLETLEALERDNPAVAQRLAVKRFVLPKLDMEKERADGVELKVAIAKKLIFDRIAPKPAMDTMQDRKEYVQAINKLHRHLAGIKTWDNMRNAIRELSDIGYKGGKVLRGAQRSLESAKTSPNRGYFDTDYFEQRVKEGLAAKALMDFTPLGERLEGFFTNYESREATLKTVQRNARGDWDEYLEPKEKGKPKAPVERGAENKKWERKAAAEHLRKGGRESKVRKPEDLMKEFGVRGVEFGNWVNDSSGKYHLQRCAEAFDDLADIVGIDPKDVSLNNRLAIAFGARGKGSALAHYEPDRKVINMTKHGGAGSLAHEWGHAMDNILYQYSHGGRESLFLASEADMGDQDPQLKTLYGSLMDSIRRPKPGERGAVRKVEVDTENPENVQGGYYPRMRAIVKAKPNAEGIKEAVAYGQSMVDQQIMGIRRVEDHITRLKSDGGNASSLRSAERRLQQYRREHKKLLESIPHMLAQDIKAVTGKPYRGTVELQTGNSAYYQRMIDSDKSKPYLQTNAEMFARVFESYVQDKLKDQKRYNNYLVHSTTEQHVKEDGAPFPIGEERTRMFKAMENLLAHVTKGKALRKALEMDLRKSLHESERNAYLIDWTSFDEPIDELLYIPINRLRIVHQTDASTNPEKVVENINKMHAGEALEPIVIGYDYDVLDGHHRVEASDSMGYTHVPCVVKIGTSEVSRKRAIEAYQELWKSFDESKVKRDERGRFSTVYHTTKAKHFRHDPDYRNSGQEWGAGLYTAPAEDVEYWHHALKDKTTGEGHPYVRQLDISNAKLLHTKDVPDVRERQLAIVQHFGSGQEARQALVDEERNNVTGETYGIRPHEIAEYRLYAKARGYDGLVAHDAQEGHQVVLFDDSKVGYGETMLMEDFLDRKKQGKL